MSAVDRIGVNICYELLQHTCPFFPFKGPKTAAMARDDTSATSACARRFSKGPRNAKMTRDDTGASGRLRCCGNAEKESSKL